MHNPGPPLQQDDHDDDHEDQDNQDDHEDQDNHCNHDDFKSLQRSPLHNPAPALRSSCSSFCLSCVPPHLLVIDGDDYYHDNDYDEDDD